MKSISAQISMPTIASVSTRLSNGAHTIFKIDRIKNEHWKFSSPQCSARNGMSRQSQLLSSSMKSIYLIQVNVSLFMISSSETEKYRQ